MTEEAVVSMHATSTNPSLKTMKFKGQIGKRPVYALLDSGSTHSFIDPRVLQGVPCKIQTTIPMIVMVANGHKMVTDSKCSNLKYTIQGHEFEGELRLLEVNGYDLILGLDWLSQFGPMKIDWGERWIAFEKEGREIKLQVQEEAAIVRLCQQVNIEKEIKEDSELIVAQIMLVLTNDDKSAPMPTEVAKVLETFSDVFENPSSLPPQRPCDHKIILLPNSKPVNLRPYRYSYFQKVELEKIIEELLKASIIQPSTSPYASPALLVKKKDGSWRLCVDYRQLNAQTVKNKYPIPLIDELLDELHGAKFFSKVDLRSGYHQIRMHVPDIEKTSFRTHQGHFEYVVMPFGLTNAPATFQALMNQIFKAYLRRFVLVFFDDILVYSPDIETHQKHLQMVMEVLRKNQLFAKRSKCSFGAEKIEYLGHIITSEGVATDPQKIEAMKSWPVPKNVRQLRGFLGLTGYYRKFIKDYGLISKPLTNQLKKNAFHWN